MRYIPAYRPVVFKTHRFKDNDAIIVAVATLSDDQLPPIHFHVPVVSFAERDAANLHQHRSLSAMTIFNHGRSDRKLSDSYQGAKQLVEAENARKGKKRN